MKNNFKALFLILTIVLLNACGESSNNSNALNDGLEYHEKYGVSAQELMNKQYPAGTKLKDMFGSIEEQLNEQEKLNKKYPLQPPTSYDSLNRIFTSMPIIGQYKFKTIKDGSELLPSRQNYGEYKQATVFYKKDSGTEITLSISDCGYYPSWMIALDWYLLNSNRENKKRYTKHSFEDTYDDYTTHFSSTPCQSNPIELFYDKDKIMWYNIYVDCKGKDYPKEVDDKILFSNYRILIANRYIIEIDTNTGKEEDKNIKEIIDKAFNWNYIKSLDSLH